MLGSFKLALFPIITLSCFKMESIDQLNTIITLLLYLINRVAKLIQGPGSSLWCLWSLFLLDVTVVGCLSFSLYSLPSPLPPSAPFCSPEIYTRHNFYCMSSLPCMVVVIVPSIQRLRPHSPSPELPPTPTLLSGGLDHARAEFLDSKINLDLKPLISKVIQFNLKGGCDNLPDLGGTV